MKNDTLINAAVNAMAVSAVKNRADGVRIIDEAAAKRLCSLFNPIISDLCRRQYVKSNSTDIRIMRREATLAFCDAVVTYMPENGDFHQYACSVIVGHITHITRSSGYRMETVYDNSSSYFDRHAGVLEREGGGYEWRD